MKQDPETKTPIGQPHGKLVATLLEHAPAAIALLDREFRYVAVSRRWTSDCRLDIDDIVGLSHFDVFPELGEDQRQLLHRALAGESFFQELERFQRADGSFDWLRWQLHPWIGDDDEILGVLIITEVLTSQIANQINSITVKEELSLLINTAENFALFMYDRNGKITIWNSGAERLFGWKEEEVVGKTLEFMYEPMQLAGEPLAKQREIARKTGSYRERVWKLRKDGSHFLADVTISYCRRDAEIPSAFGEVVRDVTQEDVQSRTLEASAVLLRSILATVPDALIVIDEFGTILSFSNAAEQLFGYDQSEVIGSNVSMLMDSPDSEMHDDYLAHYRQSGRSKIIGNKRRVFGKRKDGSLFPHTLCIAEAEVGGQRLFTGFLHDLSEIEAAEARLNELQRELAHIARISVMGTLATAMAHELNQPLMAIGSFVQTSAELLKTDRQNAVDQVTRALEEAGHEAMRAGEIVKRLRRFVSRGELERTFERPSELASDAYELATIGAKHRKVACSITVERGMQMILVDRVQIQQVLVNLINNGLEAIPAAGRVELAVYTVDGSVCFSVSDTGAGVPPEKIEHLFEPFSTTKANGMGLGLAISRSIVEAHGGKIWYQPNSAGGSIFLFTLPLSGGDPEDGR